jgi:two-component system phosphate regulon sensor histidine kinase PhoR
MSQDSAKAGMAPAANVALLAAVVVLVFAGLYGFAGLPFSFAWPAATLLALAGGTIIWRASASAATLQERLHSLSLRTSEESARRTKAPQERDAFLAGLPEPLLTVDSQRRIRFLNTAAEDLLGPDLVGRDLASALRPPDLLEAVEEAFDGSDQSQLWFTLPGKVERYFAAHSAALQTPDTDDKTVVIALYDLTVAKRAEKLRADFIANASHELRTPLASLSGFIETLQGPAREDEAARERFLQVMQEQAARMGRLIEDLLALSRIELQEHTPPTDRVSIGEILRRVGQELSYKAEGKSMELVLDFTHLPPMVGDDDDLTRVFQNLVDNAIKYGEPGTRVVIAAAVAPTGGSEDRALGRPGLMIQVKNQGEGITQDQIPRLTERFYRVNTAKSRELGGTGLGLAIVKHIVNRHKGILRIESTPGESTTVTCLFPLSDPTETGGLPR